MEKCRFTISGPNAPELAKQLQNDLSQIFGAVEEIKALPEDDRATRADWVAVTALALSLPGALLAAADLAERLELKRKLQAVIDAARALPAKEQDKILLAPSPDRQIDLQKTDADELLNFVEQTSADSQKAIADKT